MSNAAAIKYFRKRYPEIYRRMGNTFPLPEQIDALLRGKDVLASYQNKIEEFYGRIWDDDHEIYGKIIKDIVDYQLLPNKIEFEPLTLDIARRNVGKRIHIYSSNGQDPNGPLGPDTFAKLSDRTNREKVFKHWVKIINSHLYHDRTTHKKVYGNWLQNPQDFIPRRGDFLYLEAVHDFDEGDEISSVQICDPLEDGSYKGQRVLSGKCIDGKYWVEKGRY